MRINGVILLGLILLPIHLLGRERKDTLFTTDGDRIILTYKIAHSGNQTTIEFGEPQKKSGEAHGNKYKDLRKIAVMFFDRVGNYGDDVSIRNRVPEAFSTPSGVQYQKSADGYFLIQNELKLSFTVNADTEIKIPIYWAYKPKKGKYILLSEGVDLKIPLKAKGTTSSTKATSQLTQETITSTSEIEPDNTMVSKVLESVNIAMELIAKAKALPFDNSLEDEIANLRRQRRETTDEVLLAKIAEVMDSMEVKKQRLEKEEAARQLAQQQAAEAKAQQEAQALKAQNDSIAAAQQAAAEKEQQRNLWMIIGGVILAVLAFIGNQALQSIRNKRNQMQMMNMQQNIANKAEEEAKRRARNAARSQQNKITDKARKTASETIRRKTGNLTVHGKSKKASI
jgi:hypothetical protein